MYLVDRILLPVTHVDNANATHEKLQLTGIENFNEVKWDEFIESGQEIVHLRLDAGDKLPLNDKLNVFFLVFIRDWNLGTPGLQFAGHHFAKVFPINLEFNELEIKANE